MIYCQMLSGMPLTGQISQALFDGAKKMWADGEEKLDVSTQEFEGRIRTQGKHSLLGSIGGVLFEANIETDLGSTNVRFIVQTRQLPDENARWTLCMPEGDVDLGRPGDWTDWN